MGLNTYNKINLIAAYYFIVGGLLIILAAASLIIPVAAVLLGQSEFLARMPGWFLGLVLLGIAAVIGAFGGASVLIGWGLWQLRPWGRMGAMIGGLLQIPLVPIGTLAGGMILYVLLQDTVRDLFLSPA